MLVPSQHTQSTVHTHIGTSVSIHDRNRGNIGTLCSDTLVKTLLRDGQICLKHLTSFNDRVRSDGDLEDGRHATTIECDGIGGIVFIVLPSYDGMGLEIIGHIH